MIFTDVRFIALFVASWICFFSVPRSWRAATLAFWGAAIYIVYAGAFFAVVLALTVGVFFSGRRSVAFAIGAATIGLLAYFKIMAAGGAPAPATVNTVGLLIPLGFSYLSFELLHVIVERRRGRIAALPFSELLAFVFFAPARVAGPIRRFPQFSDAVREAVPSSEEVYRGLVRVLWGLAKKFFVADILALTVAEAAYVNSAGQAWAIMFAYALQIYFDFSAYSDIAIGFARILGIRLPENFARPYFASNIREFWDRWHITLSHWVRDYIFIPTGRELFKTRLRSWPAAIAAVGYLVTFLAVGAWHGLTAGFLIWGLYHGILLTMHHLIRRQTPPWLADHPWYRSRAIVALSTAITFLCVTIGWVPFMLPWKSAQRILGLMLGMGS